MVKISIIFDAHKKYSASFKIVEKVDDIKSAQFYKCDIRSLNPNLNRCCIFSTYAYPQYSTSDIRQTRYTNI